MKVARRYRSPFGFRFRELALVFSFILAAHRSAQTVERCMAVELTAYLVKSLTATNGLLKKKNEFLVC